MGALKKYRPPRNRVALHKTALLSSAAVAGSSHTLAPGWALHDGHKDSLLKCHR
jgi:hypothetical protein